MADPRKDPRYKDLYESKNTFASELLDAMKAQTELDIKDQALTESKKKSAARDSLAKSMSEGPTDDSFYERARQSLAEAGDLEGALSMDSAYRNLQKERSQEEDRDLSAEDRKLNSVTKLAEVDPELAMNLWNTSSLGKKYGLKTDASSFTKPPDYKSGAGIIYHVDKSGKLVVDYDQPEKSGTGERAPQFKQFVDAEGNMSILNMRDPDDRAEIETNNLKPYSATADSNASFEKMMSGMAEPEESGGSLMDSIKGLFGGGSAAPAAAAAPPQALPTPTPKPTPTPAPGAIKKKRHILVPKGIEQ